MITKQYTCQCCNKETSKARIVNSGHLLCNDCNIQLIMEGELFFTAESGLRIKAEKGDFLLVEPFTIIKRDYWENQKSLRENAPMDNQSMVGWDCHESY